MKKLSKVIAVAAVILTPFIFSGAAQAQEASCEITNTGPGSNNQCTISEEYECNVTNDNNVTIVNQNDQTSTSGTVNNSGNTSGGSATSGTVTNTNGTVFNVTITNGETCVVTAVTPPAPTPTPTPEVKGATVQPTKGGGAAVLPATSGDNALPMLAIVATSLAVLSALGVGGVALYRYYKSL